MEWNFRKRKKKKEKRKKKKKNEEKQTSTMSVKIIAKESQKGIKKPNKIRADNKAPSPLPDRKLIPQPHKHP